MTKDKLDAGAVVTSKIGDAQVTPAKLAVRVERTRFSPNYANSYLKAADLDTQFQLKFERINGVVDEPFYQFTNTSLSAGVKSGVIGVKMALPLNS